MRSVQCFWTSTALLFVFTSALAQPDAATDAAATVRMVGIKFVPEELTVQEGQSVVWKNDDLVPHSVFGEGLYSPVLQPGETFRWTATHKGAHPYRCTLHPMMKAQLTVR